MLIYKVLYWNTVCYYQGFDNSQVIKQSMFLNGYSIFLVQLAGLIFNLCLHLMIFMFSSAILITAAGKISDYSLLFLTTTDTWTNPVSSKASTRATLLDI